MVFQFFQTWTMSQKITFPLCLVIYLHIVSISIPENPKALSPWMDITLFPGAWSLHQIPAATANPNPTPIVPKLPASNLQAKQRTPAYLKLFVYVCNEYLHIICRFELPLDPCPFQLHEPACRRCTVIRRVLVSKCHVFTCVVGGNWEPWFCWCPLCWLLHWLLCSPWGETFVSVSQSQYLTLCRKFEL